jgi:hypothetical protein
MSLSDVAAKGNRVATLEAIRDILAISIVAADPEKQAPLVARMTDVLEQIDRLTPTAKAGDPVDEIAKRRSARGAGSAASKRRTTSDSG